MKAALFDLDGVIVDTAKYHYEAWASIAQTLGYTLSAEKNEALKGVSRDQSLMRILDWSGATVNEETFQSLLKKKESTLFVISSIFGAQRRTSWCPFFFGDASVQNNLHRVGISK